MNEKLCSQINSISEIFNQLEQDFLQFISIVSKIESSIITKDIQKTQLNCNTLKIILTEKLSLKFEKLNKQIKEIKEKSQINKNEDKYLLNEMTQTVKINCNNNEILLEQLQLQNEILKSCESSLGNRNSVSFSVQKSTNQETLSEIFDFLLENQNKEFLKVISGKKNENLNVNLRNNNFNEFKNRFDQFSKIKEAKSDKFIEKDVGPEFSVYSDFSFQMPIKRDIKKKYEETIKGNLQHVEIADILLIPSLPISIQSDDELFN